MHREKVAGDGLRSSAPCAPAPLAYAPAVPAAVAYPLHVNISACLSWTPTSHCVCDRINILDLMSRWQTLPCTVRAPNRNPMEEMQVYGCPTAWDHSRGLVWS